MYVHPVLFLDFLPISVTTERGVAVPELCVQTGPISSH